MAEATLAGPAVEDREAAVASRRRLISRIVIYGLIGLISIVYIVPLLVVVLNSFRTNQEIGAMGLISLPQSFRLDAWPQAWSDFCIGGQCNGVARYFWNSVAMVVPATIISTLLGA
ncbi:MAG TPA: carbohydrate ABC transporter permease, partial [Devosia sp.]